MPHIQERDSLSAINPFIWQHVEDAAFYWQQHDRSVGAALLDLDELLDIDWLLQSHLNGLIASGNAGWAEAWDALTRWEGPGEVFVCAVLALQAEQNKVNRLNQILEQIEPEPETLLRGLISALLWVDSKHAASVISAWSAENATLLTQVAAWRVIAHAPALARPGAAPLLVTAMRREEAPWLRAAACRAALVFAHTDALRACLSASLQDPDPAVAAEAAISLAGIGAHHGSAATLWRSLWHAFHALPSGGFARVQAERRLRRWLQHLALQVAPGQADVPRLLTTLPPRLGLHFVLHHADPAHLPWVVQQLQDDSCARLYGTCLPIQILGYRLLHRAGCPHPKAQRRYPHPDSLERPELARHLDSDTAWESCQTAR